MTFPREFFAVLTGTAMIMVFHCKADLPPPPTGLSYEWLDRFVVKVSWQEPRDLLTNYEVQFKYLLMKNATDVQKDVECTSSSFFLDSCLTEEIGSDHWQYNIWTVGSKSCESLNKSTPVAINIHTPKDRAQVVKDFKCFLHPKEMNCSWIPVNPSLNLTLSYRTCGRSEEHRKSLKKCDQPYISGMRNGCVLKVDNDQDSICMLVETEAGMSTFKPVLVVHPPKLNITEEGDKLKLSWKLPEVGKKCCWKYEVCYKKCNELKICQNVDTVKTGENEEHTFDLPYDKRCLYEFQSRVNTSTTCPKVFSDFGEVVTYGTNEPHVGTLTVVAIVIPIILSVCVILSCYCFKRHSAIICPIIPDPSAIFKEMMMANKELKTTGSLYTPVPEPIEPCKITLESENSVLQQNS